MKIKFNSGDELPLNKTIEIPCMIIVVTVVFHENKKYYPKVFLDEYLNKSYAWKKEKYNMWKEKFLYFTFLFLITIAILIAVSTYYYLMEYKAKQKHLWH